MCDCLRVLVKKLGLMYVQKLKRSGNFFLGYATVSLSVNCRHCGATVTKELGNTCHAFLPK